MQATQAERTANVSDFDSRNFEEIYQAYGERVLNMILHLTGDEELARDLTQDVFLKVYEKLPEFRGQSHIYTWIYRIALNCVINYWKKKKRQKWLDILEFPVGELFRQEEQNPLAISQNPIPPDKELEKKEREIFLWNIIQQLPEKQRIPLILHRYEGFRYEEIAGLLNISLSAVESRLHRAKLALAKKLEKWKNKI